MYLEYEETLPDGEKYITSVSRFSLSRNYTIFALMAGVRAYEGSTVLFGPRGLPEKVGWEADYDNTLYVVEGETNEEYCVSRERAERWVASGSSQWTTADKRWVTQPDWHSHSWLTLEEFEQVRDAYESIEYFTASWFQESPEVDLSRHAFISKDIDLHDITVTKTSDYRSMPYRVDVGPKRRETFPVRYRALLAALRELGEGGRIVFWFDN